VTGTLGLGVIVNLSSSSVAFETFTVAASPARDTGAFTDTLIEIERVPGTNGRDCFVGSNTANLRGERFEGLGGGHYIGGGAGYDLVSYQQEMVNFGGSGFGGNKGIIFNLSLAAITVGTNTVQAGTARDGFGYTDTLISIEAVTGTALVEYIVGGDGYNYFRGWGGADNIDGGAGDRDFLSFFVDDFYFNTPGAGTITDMVAGTAILFQDGATTTFINIEDIGGSERDDLITGDPANNQLSGDEGNDTIDGGGGLDTINYGNWAANRDSGVPVLVGINASHPNGIVVNLLDAQPMTPKAALTL
jgi:Ca2+-binding RTX toxin-like protein